MKAQHTPGPWETSSFTDVVRNVVEWDICEPGGGDMIAEVAVRPEAEANAALIAAAPELLAACLAMRKGWEHNLTEPMAKINAAIAKATGAL
jgi:hypothetical protein